MPLKILEPLSLAVKYLSVLILWGRMAGMHAPSWGASGFLSRPEGRVAAPHPPGKGGYKPGKNSDNR